MIAPPPDALFRSIVQNANDLITVFDVGGRIVFMNDVSAKLLGAPPDAFIGRSIIEFVHPEETSRAIETLRLSREYGPPHGNTHFRIRRADGTFVSLELTSGGATDGERSFLMTSGRRADTRFALEQALQQLLGGAALADVMTTVCDIFSWRQIGSLVAITWRDPEGVERWVSTGSLPEVLCGVHADPGSPWAAVRAGETGVQHGDLSALSAEARAEAERIGFGGYWIEPVRNIAEPALITIWTAAGGRPPAVHVQDMALARHIVEMILRWTDKEWRLDYAANHDELTGLPNRKSFFRGLGGSEHGAVLYCDLDRFKPVNDRYGHAVGDEVLRQVAGRLRGCVRATDLVARIGGDEFAVICPGSTAADAGVLADRIRASVEAPIAVHGGAVSVGISIGTAHTTDRLDAASVAAADQALYEVKARRRAGRQA